VGGDVSPPVLTYKVEPKYTREAEQAKVSGSVLLSLVVDENGSPRDIQVIRGLGSGLDEKAVETVSKWRFRPGMRFGKPVAVQARVEVNFRLLSPEEARAAREHPEANPVSSPPLNAAQWPSPATAEEFILRGQQYMRERNYTQAANDATEALKMEPGSARALHLRGSAYYNAGNLAERDSGLLRRSGERSGLAGNALFACKGVSVVG
jgi:TonB family protein